MTKWAHSLIRISTYEVETLQKRLSDVAARRQQCEMRIATLDAEYELETARAANDTQMAAHLPAYRSGFKLRREEAVTTLTQNEHEEMGVRDELTRAFEELKKFEHVAEATKLRQSLARNRAENAAMDETALRLKRAV
jgi:flagellar FliJ protein